MYLQPDPGNGMKFTRNNGPTNESRTPPPFPVRWAGEAGPAATRGYSASNPDRGNTGLRSVKFVAPTASRTACSRAFLSAGQPPALGVVGMREGGPGFEMAKRHALASLSKGGRLAFRTVWVRSP